MLRTTRLAAAATLLAAGTATGAELQMDDFAAESLGSVTKLCSAEPSTEMGQWARGFCYGWIEGVEQFYDEILLDDRFEFEPTICPGREVSREEVRTLLVDWSNNNPDLQGIPPLDGLIRAGREIFPCP
ncbi:MAG: Rap1a/Tai family immunity protein [Pseudomonadota bacterium]